MPQLNQYTWGFLPIILIIFFAICWIYFILYIRNYARVSLIFFNSVENSNINENLFIQSFYKNNDLTFNQNISNFFNKNEINEIGELFNETVRPMDQNFLKLFLKLENRYWFYKKLTSSL